MSIAAATTLNPAQLELGKLIYLFDNNHVTLSAGTNITSNEDCAQRFEAYGWHTQSLENGNDCDAIDSALRVARSETRRPSLILVQTFLAARFSGAERHRRRLAKVAELESRGAKS
jgi:transketolase